MLPPRITQHDVARAAGVDRSTVSLALRQRPGIPRATRERVLRAAEKLGYTPDPVLSALSAYRWPASSSMRRSIISIATVDLLRRNVHDYSGYTGEMRRSAMQRARALGLAVSAFSLPHYDGNVKRMLGAMRARGITGIILLPADRPNTLDPKAGWDAFSVVAATTSVLAPRFHQVIPNTLHNMTALLERMHELGYRKIGAIFSEGYEQRTIHAYSMALAWFGHRDRILVLPGDVASEENERRMSAWFRQHSFDFVFASHAEAAVRRAHEKASGAGHSARFRYPAPSIYFEQFPDLIGETAVQVLTGLIHSRQTGIPVRPQLTMIEGALRENLARAIRTARS